MARPTRKQKIERALEEGRRLSFQYMNVGGGRASIKERLVDPLSLSTTTAGRTVLTAEDYGRHEGRPRAFRLERMFHVDLV